LETIVSHHLDSPISRQDIRLDITDLYVFRGEKGTVFVINLCHSIFGSIPAPGYHPEGFYEFKVDLNGDAVEELTYRFTFDEHDCEGKQRYVVRYTQGAESSECTGCYNCEELVPGLRRSESVMGVGAYRSQKKG
jgi:Domain of unknown function (DUF4331)